jgi:hypothetical protein
LLFTSNCFFDPICQKFIKKLCPAPGMGLQVMYFMLINWWQRLQEKRFYSLGYSLLEAYFTTNWRIVTLVTVPLISFSFWERLLTKPAYSSHYLEDSVSVWVLSVKMPPFDPFFIVVVRFTLDSKRRCAFTLSGCWQRWLRWQWLWWRQRWLRWRRRWLWWQWQWLWWRRWRGGKADI